MIKYYPQERFWSKDYKIIPEIINSKKYKVGAEIGVAHGGHSLTILETTKVKKLYCIDPYKHQDNYNDPMNLSQKDFDQLFSKTQNRLKSHKKRVEFIRKFSAEASESVKDTLDFIYIDGDHSYEGVKSDIENWYRKIRVGGTISGHDYGHVNFPGVKKAVDSYFKRFNYKINVEDGGVWWVEKKEQPISYIMPLYNASGTVKESLLSIKANLTNDDEIVITDDGSTDNSIEIVKKLSKNLPIEIIQHKRNKGGGAARNTSVINSKHNLLFCLDSDNILISNSITKLKDSLFTSSNDISIFSTWEYFNEDKTTHKWKLKENAGDITSYLSSYRVPGASGNYLYTRNSWEQVGGYPEFAHHLDTWGFGFYQSVNGYNTSTVDGAYRHRHGHNSYWTSGSKKNNTSRIVLQLLIPYLHLIEESDIKYITSKNNRNEWFNKIETRPLRLKSNENDISVIKKILKILK